MQKVKGRRWTARDERQAVLRRILVLLILLWQFCEQTNPYVNYHGGSCQVIKILKKQDLQPAGVCTCRLTGQRSTWLSPESAKSTQKNAKSLGHVKKAKLYNQLRKMCFLFTCTLCSMKTVGTKLSNLPLPQWLLICDRNNIRPNNFKNCTA